MIYFDNAATSQYRPKCVIDAAVNAFACPANPGRSGHYDAVNAALTVHSAREAVKRLVNNPDAEVVFTKNCTEALNLAILGTARQGHVITTVTEHNSVLRPLFELQRAGTIRLTVLDTESGTIKPSTVERKICPDTYMVAINHASNVTGAINDIAEIGKIISKQGIILLVDGAQSLGHIAFDMRSLGADIIASAGHKGLHGAQGTGFLCYNKRLKIRPIFFGGTGTESESTYQPKTPPESLESGTVNTPGIAALGAGINWTLNNFEKINSKIQTLCAYITEELKRIPEVELFCQSNLGVISLRVGGCSSSQISDILNDRYGIAVRSGLHCAPLMHKSLNTFSTGLTRISVGYNNTMREAKTLVRAIREIAAETIDK